MFVMVWAARLAGKDDHFNGQPSCAADIVAYEGFLLFRVLKTGSDTRFDDIRSHFFKFFGTSLSGLSNTEHY